MIHAYDERYLGEVMKVLAAIYDLVVNYENIDIDEFSLILSSSSVGKSFENGDLIVILGKSSNEILAELLEKEPLRVCQDLERSEEYWVGWVLAYTMWFLNKSFKEIFAVISAKELVNLYYPYHEADISKICDLIKARFPKETKLKQLRNKRKLSQTELSYLSGVSLRSIRAYEQRVNDVNKAEGIVLYCLSDALNCKIEDILE